MSDPNTPSNPDASHVPDVPQVPDVPHVPDVPQVPDIPRDEAGTPSAPTPPPAYSAPPATPPPAYSAPPTAPPPAYGAPTPPVYGTPTSAQVYGTPSSAPYSAPVANQPILSILAMVAGILGLLGSPIVFLPIVGGILGLFIPAAAVVLGFLGKSKEPQARGFWLTGLITGFIGVGLALISIVIWSVLFATIPDTSSF